jgi:hypothetical protein
MLEREREREFKNAMLEERVSDKSNTPHNNREIEMETEAEAERQTGSEKESTQTQKERYKQVDRQVDKIFKA